MDQILNALGGLLLKALPTFLLVLLVHFYLKQMFYRPLDKVLDERYRATEGARELAQESMETAARKTAEYEAAIRDARGELYREQEEVRKQWRREHAAAVEEARRDAEAQVGRAKADLAAGVEEARRTLEAESETLAGRIVESILRRRIH
jgi:F-type H+-transporting ATPase subunit b